MKYPTHIKEFFYNRKINNDTLEKFNVTWNGNHIEYPVENFSVFRRDPRITTGAKYLYQKGSKATLYGADKIKDADTVLITEGMNDCLACWSAGIPAVSSTGGALTFKIEWLEYLKNKRVIICLDSDETGGKGMYKIYSMIPNSELIFLPNGIKDICDFSSAGGDLQSLLKTAKKLNTIEEVREDMTNRLALYQSVFFHDIFIKEHTKVNTHTERKTYSNDRVTNAKLYPITNLLEFKKDKALCPFHNEKTPSLHYYHKTNTCYCFGGCAKAYDSISIYMQKYGVSFKEAVEQLNRLV